MGYRVLSRYDVEVDNLDDAIKLAEEWKSEGKYDWFRGQEQPWPLSTTLTRAIKIEGIERAKRDIYFLVEHFRKLPSFSGILENTDKIWIIAQHYGLPTHFLDFTTEPSVAGFFASTKKSTFIGSQGCIYCLSTKEFTELQNFIRRGIPDHPTLEIELIDIKVKDLWRHQAQKGCFMYLPFEGIERQIPLNRILFTHSSTHSPIERHLIYPNRKSHLEIILDQFFKKKEAIEGYIRMRDFAVENDFEIKTIAETGPFDSKFFKEGHLPKHSSWRKLSLWSEWTSREFQNYYSEKKEVRFTISCTNDWKFNQEIISDIIWSKRLHKCGMIKWRLQVEGLSSISIVKSVNKLLNTIWDGMRLYPYTNLQIGASMALTIKLVFEAIDHGYMNWKKEEFREELLNAFPNLIQIEMGKEEGISRRLYVGKGLIRKKFRSNLCDYLKDEYVIYRNNPEFEINMLLIAHRPPYLFRFKEFVDLFVEVIIPYQALVCKNSDVMFFFNPAEIRGFGMA